MRYREGTTPGELGPPVGEDMAIGTAVFALIVGIGFVIAALRAREGWLAVLGGMLAVGSVGYLGAVVLGLG